MTRLITWLLAVLVVIAIAEATDAGLRKRNVFSVEEEQVSGANAGDFFHEDQRFLSVPE